MAPVEAGDMAPSPEAPALAAAGLTALVLFRRFRAMDASLRRRVSSKAMFFSLDFYYHFDLVS
jgi:hypothetical protein